MLTLTSKSFKHNGLIPILHTCDGEEISPPLKISKIPKGTKSLALIVDDPDAPGGSFTHWVVYGISPEKTQFPQGEAPAGAQEGRNSSGSSGYYAPCPPSGTHRYMFHLFALDNIPNFDGIDPEDVTAEELQSAIDEHVIEQTTLIGLYVRDIKQPLRPAKGTEAKVSNGASYAKESEEAPSSTIARDDRTE